jgi:hypothetical protein
MKIYISLLALTRVTLASDRDLLDRAPIAGVVSLAYSRSSTQLQRRDGFVELSVGASYINYVVNITVGTPPQPITLTLDTGSSDTLLLTQESALCLKNAGLCPSVGYCK